MRSLFKRHQPEASESVEYTLGKLLQRRLTKFELMVRRDMIEYDSRLAKSFFRELHRIPQYANIQAVERIQGRFLTADGLVIDNVAAYERYPAANILNYNQLQAAWNVVLAIPLKIKNR